MATLVVLWVHEHRPNHLLLGCSLRCATVPMCNPVFVSLMLQIMKGFEARCLELTEGGNQLDEEAARQRLQELEVLAGSYGTMVHASTGQSSVQLWDCTVWAC